MDLKTTFNNLLLADSKGDYIEFDPSRAMLHLDITLDLPAVATNKLRSLSPMPGRNSLLTEIDSQKLLLLSGDGKPSVSPHLSPRKLSHRNQSPAASQNSRHGSPASSCSSLKKEKSTEKLPSLLFPGRRSPGSLTPQNTSPMHHQVEGGARNRPMSLFVTPRDRDASRQDAGEDRYVREPTKLVNLKQTLNQSATGLVINGGDAHQMQLRRGSEGMLNMNSDGYVSFVGVTYSRDQQANPTASTGIQIKVTQEL
jgi:hypothetical protein